MYQVKLADFQGPLDLLIHLIEKDKIDIYDIPIVSVTEQYIAYINAMQEYNLDVASEFLLMAAILLQIKSRMLLPRDRRKRGRKNPDPRQMLVDMLVEYRKTKKLAQALRECLQRASLQTAPVSGTPGKGAPEGEAVRPGGPAPGPGRAHAPAGGRGNGDSPAGIPRPGTDGGHPGDAGQKKEKMDFRQLLQE